MRSTGGPTVYAFSWKAEADRVVLGGFSYSEGQPTYQAAIIGLAQLIALRRCRPSPQSEEVVARWYALVDAMEAAYPRTNQDAGWPGRTLAAAAANPALLPHIEGVADALYHACICAGRAAACQTGTRCFPGFGAELLSLSCDITVKQRSSITSASL